MLRFCYFVFLKFTQFYNMVIAVVSFPSCFLTHLYVSVSHSKTRCTPLHSLNHSFISHSFLPSLQLRLAIGNMHPVKRYINVKGDRTFCPLEKNNKIRTEEDDDDEEDGGGGGMEDWAKGLATPVQHSLRRLW